jgi:phosphatidate cytidylyltransferase
MASQWADIPRRMTTICIGVPVLWIVWSHEFLRHLFFQGTHIVVCYEWIHLTSSSTGSLWKWGFLILSLALTTIADDSLFLLSLVGTVGLASVLGSPTEALTMGLLLITVPFRGWCFQVSNSFEATFSLLLVVWNSDSQALVAGRLSKYFLKQPRRQPEWLRRISPAKSMAGLVGGLVGGTLTYIALPLVWRWIRHYQLAPAVHDDDLLTYYEVWYYDGIARGLVLSLAAALGDLWESSLKRKYAVKDSGKFLPGHGGVLDRFDSSLLVVLLFPRIVFSYK